MAPTVFSYWRREDRRSSSSSVPSSPLPAPTKNSPENPPQLPGIRPTPSLTDTIIESSALSEAHSPSPSSGNPPDVVDTKKPETGASGSSTRRSPTNLRVPTPQSEQASRPNSSPEESKKVPVITSQSNHSQQSFSSSRHDRSGSDSSKPSSPWKLAFGKGLLQSSDDNKRKSTHGGLAGGDMRFKTSTGDSGGEAAASPKEFRLDNISSRRNSSHDLTAEHTPQKSGKTKLHMLNPMSLLARRRSSPLAKSSSENANIGVQNLVPAIPDDYDPRIRGKIVHDFSAPRPRRNVSSDHPAAQDAGKQVNGSDSPRNGYADNEQKKRKSEHSPVFQEHFEDDQDALQVENKGYLQSPLLTNPPRSDRESSSVPAFAQNLPSSVPGSNDEPVEQTVETTEQPSAQPPLKHSPSKAQEQGAADTTQQASGLPRHFKSNASRFSFDMVGAGSSVQERLLEEKHKQKEAARKAKAELERRNYSDSEYEDDFDYDMDNDDNGLEERIPGVNVDADEDEFADFSGPGKILNGSLSVPAQPPATGSLSGPTDPNLAAPQTSQELQGQAIGPADGGSPKEEDTKRSSILNGEPIGLKPPEGTAPTVSKVPLVDDFYFDDGGFGDLPPPPEGEKFDESIFDDPTSDLYKWRVVVPLNGISRVDDDIIIEKPTRDQSVKHVTSMVSEFQDESREVRNPSVEPSKAQSGVLSEHNLEAFHNALEKVANEAAANERFERTTSESGESMDQQSSAQTADSHPGLVSDDSRLSQTVDTMGFEDVFDDFSNYEDGYDDDPIIAEANAEALENDEDGFYGREFGFYARAHGNCSPELGGYFGPRDVEGLNRSHSGRGNFREPSLTPITERSEWSTRNSVVSLAHGAAHSNPSLGSPGLAQLVDMGSIDDEMSALMKLRQEAWGGSNGSARSSTGCPSPHLQQPSSNRGSFTSIHEAYPNPVDANCSLADSMSALNVNDPPLRPSDGENSPASPTLTSGSHADAGRPATRDGDGKSGVKAGAGKSHSRTGSAASISYVKETDEDGSSKWVVERRRTGDGGEMEVYEREVLAQGRI